MISNCVKHFLFTLDWLWQDYILYEYYKAKLVKRVEAFGRERVETEKVLLRRTLSRAISECHKPHDTAPNATSHFCNYYKKDELQMLVEVRDAQQKRCMKISKVSKSPTTRR